jgi:hypothetical protein
MFCMATNRETFQAELEKQYSNLFATDPDYAYSASKISAGALATKMTAGLVTLSASKTGEGIKRTCKTLGIGYTYKAIRAYLVS